MSQRSKLPMAVCILTISIILAHTPILPVQADPGSYIDITGMTNNQVYNYSPTIFNGTYSSPDPQTTIYEGVSTTSNPPTVTIVIDNRGIGTANIVNGQWSITTDAIPDGWHTLSAFIDDSNGDHNTSLQFEILTSHFQPTKYSNFIAVEYSNTCATLVKNNITSDCPSVSELMKWDNSNQAVSGHFVLQKDGTYIRDKPEVPNFYSYYGNNNYTTICILCNADLANQDTTPVIFIEPHGFTYTQNAVNSANTIIQNGFNSTVEQNEQVKGTTTYHDRYIAGCLVANMAYIDFSSSNGTRESLMNDTIHDFESGCTKTDFNSTGTIPIGTIDVDAARQNSMQYHYQDWLAASKTINTGNCITQVCTLPKNPTHNSGFGW